MILPMLLATAYLDSLNSEQRRAVEHGIGAAGYSRPLLVVAGVGGSVQAVDSVTGC